jgi:hypothetical protein
MALISYMKTAMNKRILISESCDDLNRCTPCRGKSDQHDMYASHAIPRMPGVRFIRAVPVRGTLSRAINIVEQGHCSREKGLPTIHNTLTDRSVGPYPASFPSQPIKKWGQSQASIDYRLLGLLGPYHQHAIGTFNTCSWGPTHRPLTYTGGGYNLGGADFPYTTPLTSQPAVSPFHLRALPGLKLSNNSLPSD